MGLNAGFSNRRCHVMLQHLAVYITLDRMFKIAVERILTIVAWLLGASGIGVGYFYLQTYVYGVVDPAYGNGGTFTFGLIATTLVVVSGFVGFMSALLTYSQWQTPAMSFVGGLIFSISVGGISGILSLAFSGLNLNFMALIVPILLGGLSSRVGLRHGN